MDIFVLAPVGGIGIPDVKIIFEALIYIKYNPTIFIISIFKPFLTSKIFFVHNTDNMLLFHEIWISNCHNFWRKGPIETGFRPKCPQWQAKCKYRQHLQQWRIQSLKFAENHHFATLVKNILVIFVLAPVGGIGIPNVKIILEALIYIKYNVIIFII